MNGFNFSIDSWDEATSWENNSNEKITRATVTKTFKGDMQGSSRLEYILNYSADGNATFVGIERVTATIGKKTGSFVAQHQGGFANGIASSTFTVISGSATGELVGLVGKGEYASGHAPIIAFKFDYAFE